MQMKKETIEILSCSFGQKIIKIVFHDKELDLNMGAKKEEHHHPDLQKALVELSSNLADSCWINSAAKDNFIASGFSIDEKDSKTVITIDGKMTNKHGYIVGNMDSGIIPYESERLIKKVDLLRDELFQYFFEGKCAQGTIPGMTRSELKEGGEE